MSDEPRKRLRLTRLALLVKKLDAYDLGNLEVRFGSRLRHAAQAL